MSVDALAIWWELSGARECREAIKYYSGKYPGLDNNARRKKILERGSADFDRKFDSDDEFEKKRYKAEYYVSRHGYMDMHIKQNLAAFRHCFKDGMPQPLLFVDFGCGPMTAGLSLAELLFKQAPDYKAQTAYFGVEASDNMVEKAKHINSVHELFAPEHFKITQGTEFDWKMVPHSFPEPQTAVLCFSFVLAPRTLKSDIQEKDAVRSLADTWKTGIDNRPECQETKIIYLNPLPYEFHKWWRVFKHAMLAPDAAGKFCYTPSDFTKLRVASLSNEIRHEIICGTPK